MTRHGGFLAYVSADGRTLCYAEREGPSPLWSLALPDGPHRQVVDCVVSRTVALGPDGIYYVGCPPPDEAWLTPTMGVQQWRPRLYRFDPARGGSQLLGTLPSNGGFERLAISPKTRTILFGMIVTAEADLMLIETFR